MSEKVWRHALEVRLWHSPILSILKLIKSLGNLRKLNLEANVVLALALGLGAVGGADFYVGPNGDDGNAGTQEKPFATLERARTAARTLKAKGRPLPGEITVHVAAGRYLRTESFILTGADSGGPGEPMVYRGACQETRQIAGQIVPAERFLPINDAAVLARLDPAARGKVLQLDLKPLHVQHAGPFPPSFKGSGGLLELFFNNTRMPLARWPDQGYATMRQVLDSGLKPQPHQGTFIYRGERPARWQAAARAGRLWLVGFWRVPWVIETVQVESINTSRKTITLAVLVENGIGSKYSKEINGTRPGDGKEPWYALNLLEELASRASGASTSPLASYISGPRRTWRKRRSCWQT